MAVLRGMIGLARLLVFAACLAAVSASSKGNHLNPDLEDGVVFGRQAMVKRGLTQPTPPKGSAWSPMDSKGKPGSKSSVVPHKPVVQVQGPVQASFVIVWQTNDVAFPPELLLQWLELAHELGVDDQHVTVLTPLPFADQSKLPHELSSRLTNLGERYVSTAGVCDVLAAAQKATHWLYLVIGMHGTNGMADGSTVPKYLDGGVVPFKEQSVKTACPEGLVTKVNRGFFPLTGEHLIQLADGKAKMVAFIEACFAGAMFAKKAKRLDPPRKQHQDVRLQKAKAALYDAPPVPHTLFITSASDNCKSRGGLFTSTVASSIRSALTAEPVGTWQQVMDALKKAATEQDNRKWVPPPQEQTAQAKPSQPQTELPPSEPTAESPKAESPTPSVQQQHAEPASGQKAEVPSKEQKPLPFGYRYGHIADRNMQPRVFGDPTMLTTPVKFA